MSNYDNHKIKLFQPVRSQADDTHKFTTTEQWLPSHAY